MDKGRQIRGSERSDCTGLYSELSKMGKPKQVRTEVSSGTSTNKVTSDCISASATGYLIVYLYKYIRTVPQGSCQGIFEDISIFKQ